MGRAAEAPFNNPFADRATARRLRRLAVAPARGPAPPVPRQREHRRGEPDADTLWWDAVRGGVPLPGRDLPRLPAGPADTGEFIHPDEAAAAQLAAFVGGAGRLDVLDTDEAVESPPGRADPVVLDRLRRGTYAVQRHLDLHGLRVDDARSALHAFFREAQRDHLRCVLVVHGRGLHSKDHEPILKAKVVGWLSRGGLSRCVLAFATARPHDGGAGAVYVLLRQDAPPVRPWCPRGR